MPEIQFAINSIIKGLGVTSAKKSDISGKRAVLNSLQIDPIYETQSRMRLCNCNQRSSSQIEILYCNGIGVFSVAR